MWHIKYTPQAQKDSIKIAQSGLKAKVYKLLSILNENPYKSPPKFEKLKGDLEGACSRRINNKHRLIYQILDKEKIVKIIRMWTHYE